MTDVQASWNKDKMVNYLVLRLTPLAAPLNRSVCKFVYLFHIFTHIFRLKAIPSRSPTHSGYVEWEAKRGKWSKRWMQLREHSIWLSKRDNVSKYSQMAFCTLHTETIYFISRDETKFSFALCLISMRIK